MIREFRQSAGMQYVAVLLCALFGLGVLGIGERSEAEATRNGGVYQGVFPTPDQPHHGQDRGDESDLLIVGASSLYVTNTTSSTITYAPGALRQTADPFGSSVYWLPRG